MSENDNTIHQLHSVELEILTVVDEFCKKNNIAYSLYAGTLLGAVRHKGFIPWDDDVDICMLREDYDRFIELWEKSNNSEYILQNKENTPTVVSSFTKIRKDHTTFFQSDEPGTDYHTGIFIDIFPFDRYPNGKLKQWVYKWNLMRYLLYSREFVPPKGNALIKFVSRVLLAIPKAQRNKIRLRMREKIRKYNSDRNLNLVDANIIEGLSHLMPSNLPEEYTQLEFEGRWFSCYADYDGLLRAWYGNYMELPPESERVWKHRPILLDFDHNYNEIKEKL